MSKGSRGGLRRVDPALFCGENDWGGNGGPELRRTKDQSSDPLLNNADKSLAEMEDRHQQLIRISEVVRANLQEVLEKLGRVVGTVRAMEDGELTGNWRARELLHEYERIIWPTVVDVELHIKLLARIIRETINACKVNEPGLAWVLAFSKFQMQMEQVMERTVKEVCADLDRVLNLSVRGEVRGLKLKDGTIHAIAETHDGWKYLLQ